MVKVQIGSVVVEMNKNEAKEIGRIQDAKVIGGQEYAQRAADIWMRSAPTEAAQNRRKAAVKALGLSDVITFQ